MIKRAASYTFYVIIYLSGIAIGGIYTPEVIAYVDQLDQQRNVEREVIQQKPSHLKKKRQRAVSVG